MEQIIVIAWAESALRPVGKARVDLGERRKMVSHFVGRACTWLLRGTEADLKKAKVHARLHGYMVFTFPTSEQEPLEKARALAVQAANEGKVTYAVTL